jgi:hypothetical protein
MQYAPGFAIQQMPVLLDKLFPVGLCCLRLIDQKQPEWNSRTHFFRFAAHLMRQILVDYARARNAAKRGGGLEQVTLTDLAAGIPERSVDLLALDEALNRLAALDERRALVLEAGGDQAD